MVSMTPLWVVDPLGRWALTRQSLFTTGSVAIVFCLAITQKYTISMHIVNERTFLPFMSIRHCHFKLFAGNLWLFHWCISVADPGGPWGPRPPFAPKISSKSSSFQAILNEKNHYFEQFLGSGPPLGSKLRWAPWPISWIRACILAHYYGLRTKHSGWRDCSDPTTVPR